MIEVFPLAAAEVIWAGLIAAVAAPGAALLVGRQLNQQRKEEKEEDYQRQDRVAAKAETARVELAENNKRVADEAYRQQEQVAAVAAGAAELLVKAQATTKQDADEVARIASHKGTAAASAAREKLLAVVISHPSGLQRKVELDGIPVAGDHILLRGTGPNEHPQKVVNVLWVEAHGSNGPSVIVVVQPPKVNNKVLGEAAKAAQEEGIHDT